MPVPRRWQYVLVLVALLAGGCLPAADATLPWTPGERAAISTAAAHATHSGRFAIVRSPHFIVRSQIDATFSAEADVYLERLATTAAEVLGLPPPREHEPAEVTIYDTQDQYQRGIGKLACSRGQFDWWYAGAWAPPVYTIQTYIASAQERQFAHFCLPILNHEVTHFLLQCRAGRHRIPDAIHEGIASYMQSWNIFQDASWNRAHRRSAFAVDLARGIRHGTLPSFSTLIGVPTWDVDNFGPLTNARYAGAESFIDFLVATPAYHGFLHTLLSAAFEGEDTRSLIRSAVGEELQTAWRAAIGLSPR